MHPLPVERTNRKVAKAAPARPVEPMPLSPRKSRASLVIIYGLEASSQARRMLKSSHRWAAVRPTLSHTPRPSLGTRSLADSARKCATAGLLHQRNNPLEVRKEAKVARKVPKPSRLLEARKAARRVAKRRPSQLPRQRMISTHLRKTRRLMPLRRRP